MPKHRRRPRVASGATRRREGAHELTTQDTSSGLTLGQAVALGAIQGPAELLPVSSSGHLVLVPALLGWDYSRLDPHLRKSFEVTLHAGSAAALLIAMRREAAVEARSLDVRSAVHVVLTFVPPALVGYFFEEPIERRLGTAESVAVAQIVAGLALGAADSMPATRSRGEARSVDFLAIGVAQALALLPGVSRNGATVTAARLRHFDRESSTLLSWQAALPIVAGATLLKGARIRSRGMPRGMSLPFAAGTLSAFGTALLAAKLVKGVGSYRPIAAYRVALGAVSLVMRRR